MADSTEYLREIAHNTSHLTYGSSGTIIIGSTIIPDIRIVTLATNNREYPSAFSNIKLLEIFCRNLIEIHYAFNTGDIAANKYRTIPAGVSQPINFPSGFYWTGNLYLTSVADNALVEIETWT